MTVLKAVNDEQGQSYETKALLEQIARLQEQNEALRKSRQGKLTMKVSDKGAVSVYGMGRWPVTLYGSQWERLFESVPQIQAFLEANRELLSVKG